MSALEIAFWALIALLAYTHLGYPLLLRLLVALRGRARSRRREHGERGLGFDVELPHVSLIIAAHNEEAVIERKVEDALELDYPRSRLELIVASDGSTDSTVELARGAGADLVLDLPRRGKVAALNAAVERATGAVLAFSDANAFWHQDALRILVERLGERGVGYACGQLRLLSPSGDNQEGLYWRYEMVVRDLESRLAGITAGNGAINAVRREAYVFLEPERGQDISLPFNLVKRGWLPLYEPRAVAEERMAATIADELGRKRRMMAGAWGTMLGGGMLSPRGYRPLYALEIASHRLLRYGSPLLHLAILAINLALLGGGWVYTATLVAQLGLLAAAALAPILPAIPLRIARYYVAVTTASALGLWDYLRRGVPVTWEKAGGTREA
jgi:cellulose synthase/poly-beta-1,6-N-acetylglucosamine synthase-like glycosyltransferase